MNPIDWGNSPMAVGLIRGVLGALLTGVLYGLKAYVYDGVTWQQAVGQGSIPAVTALLVLLGYGAVDQNRANIGKVNPGDVPVAIAARTQGGTPVNVARAMTRKAGGS